MAKTVRDSYMQKRYSSLLKAPKFTDCSFIVGSEKILAHRVILAASSPVFEAMFFGSLPSHEIEICDISVNDFKQMLSFIYTDSIDIVTIEDAWRLIYIAKKYIIADLLDYCLKYVKHNLESNNLLMCYEFADLYSEDTLKSMCLNTVCVYAKNVLSHDYHMKPSTLCTLLDQEKLNVTEEEILASVLNWARKECHLRETDITNDNVRNVLIETGVFSRLRFLYLCKNCLDYKEKISGILTEDEISSIELWKKSHSVVQVKDLKFSMNPNPRCAIPVSNSVACRHVLKIGSVYYAQCNSSLTTFVLVNKRILVGGLLLPSRRPSSNNTDSKYVEELHVTIIDCDHNEKIFQFSFCENVAYDTVYTVAFRETVLFEKGIKYSIQVQWPYPDEGDEFVYLLHYFPPSMLHKGTYFTFGDPLDGGFIQGISYYSY